uniref:Uncharacterized protein n=1 Tax=Tanacetum cinerariifolium TaxID=118510 RepID=A0A6L2MAK6_TANCI|nr:hypothetical protein [Tanacetum cinerariifolium]
MAANGPDNVVARRVTDDLIAFNGETAVPKYMKFFLAQKVVETRCFVNRMRDEADAIRSGIAQTTVVIAELQAMEDQDEVHDIFLAAKDAKRSEESKLLALHEVITKALEEIESQRNDVDIIDRFVSIEHDMVVQLWKWMNLVCSCCLQVMSLWRWSAGNVVSITKDQRLIAELEALGKRADVLKPLEYMMWFLMNGS